MNYMPGFNKASILQMTNNSVWRQAFGTTTTFEIRDDLVGGRALLLSYSLILLLNVISFASIIVLFVIATVVSSIIFNMTFSLLYLLFILDCICFT